MSFLDATGQAKQMEDDGRKPYVAVKDIWTEYPHQKDGSVKAVDKISWIKKGQQNPPVNDCYVHRMPKYYADVWAVIEPTYKKWKEGQSAPIDGTPLAAWPGATPQLVKALEPVHIRSVEDLALMADADADKINLPGVRAKITQAKAYLEAQKNMAGADAKIVALEQRNAFLEKEIAEIRAALIPKEEVKRGPGRPPKSSYVHNPDNDGTRIA